MRNRKNVGEQEEQTIDLTPMLDVVFIMLIFFIVTATFIKEPGADIIRPEAETAELDKKVRILVAINENNEIWIDKKEVDPNGVRAQIERLRAENPKSPVIIQADRKANIETLTIVADAARDAGVPNVAIASDEK